MPLYEYYCRPCAAKFELLRPMSRSDEPAVCPEGHRGAARTLSVVAPVGRAGGADDAMSFAGGGGCACGGACSCAGH
jgi:putative FmdB family regulatory protein